MQVNPNFEFMRNRKHKFKSSEGWSLCNYCGHAENAGNHIKLPDGFEPIETAPKNATEIEVVYISGTRREPFIAHWAQDLSGEDQPPFSGWFVKNYSFDGKKCIGFRQIDEPDGWRPIQGGNDGK